MPSPSTRNLKYAGTNRRTDAQTHRQTDKQTYTQVILPQRACGFLLSQIGLSIVCLFVTFVRPTKWVEAFGNMSSPLCALAIL